MLDNFCGRLTEMRSAAPIVFWTLIALLGAEAGAVLIAPLVVPDYIYLRSYLSGQAEDSLEEFYAGDSVALEFDEVCGWQNRPGFVHGDWVIDQYGGRSSKPIAVKPDYKLRVLFLGSSMINGGSHISTAETISAAIEDSTTEALNMGTMLYSLDQSLLLYTSTLRKFGSDVVVVALSGRPTERLVSRFIPFYRRSEVNMPYFKPRFLLQDGELVLLPVPARDLCAAVLEPKTDLHALLDFDGYYESFTGFRRFGSTPIANKLWDLTSRAANMLLLMEHEEPDLDLLIGLMHRMEDEVRRDDARVIYLLLPDRKIVTPGWRSKFPDQYGQMVDRLQNEKFHILDGRQVFIESNEAFGNLYYSDQFHYSPRGNQIIAAALKPLLQ